MTDRPDDNDDTRPEKKGGNESSSEYSRRGRIGDGLFRRDPNRKPYWERRREKIRDEIARNRRGEYVVPTWVLVIALIAVIAGWAALIFFGGRD